jgi:hypothetical protein
MVDSTGVRVVSLNCPGCGAALEVGPALSQLACGYCGKVATVERSGGTIALLPMVAAIERVQVGTDRPNRLAHHRARPQPHAERSSLPP